jgi:predicted O-methyltransferase YrrM
MNPNRLKLLQDLKQRDLSENVPSITENTARFIHFMCQIHKPKKVLEIGTAHAYSTIWIADAIEPWEGKLISIDHSTLSFPRAEENIEKARLRNTKLLFGRAQTILKEDFSTYDFVFLDAQKRHYAELWELIKPRLAPKALVIVDDVLKFPEKTKDFHAKIKAETGFQNIIVPTDIDDGVMLLLRQ